MGIFPLNEYHVFPVFECVARGFGCCCRAKSERRLGGRVVYLNSVPLNCEVTVFCEINSNLVHESARKRFLLTVSWILVILTGEWNFSLFDVNCQINFRLK